MTEQDDLKKREYAKAMNGIEYSDVEHLPVEDVQAMHRARTERGIEGIQARGGL